MTIDTNLSLFRWPFRRLPLDDTTMLAAKLRERGVTQAWCGSFEGLLHRDVAGVNQRLADECARVDGKLLLPFGTVNPALPDWEDDLRRCHETHHMRGVRLHPNYHGYRLDDPRFAELLRRATERGLIVQLVFTMEDERTQHPLMLVPHVDAKPLAVIVSQLPQLQLVLLNAFRAIRPDAAADLTKAGQVWFDIAMLEGVAGVGKLAEQITPERIVFGSHAPLFYWESAELKLRESGLAESAIARIRTENAARIIGPIGE